MYKSEIDIAVLILFFNRPALLKKVFEQVKIARPSRLYLFQDGAREGRPDDVENVRKCREIVADIDWDCEVHINYQEKNNGCDPSEYISQKWMFETEEMGIILEDDDVPSQSFFPFCKELLEKYKDDDRISMICGMNNTEVTDYCPYDYFFSTTGSINGWASWKRVIDTYDPDYKFLDDPYAFARLRENFNDKKRGFNRYIETCKRHKASGREHYESILSASMYLYDRLNVVPTKNMILNIGQDGESTHGAASLDLLPKGVRRIFTMKTYELEFPLKHPPYVMEDKQFLKDLSLVMGYGNRMVGIYRKFESLFYRFRAGGFSAIKKSLKLKKLKQVFK